jgi:hypothetical protein
MAEALGCDRWTWRKGDWACDCAATFEGLVEGAEECARGVSEGESSELMSMAVRVSGSFLTSQAEANVTSPTLSVLMPVPVSAGAMLSSQQQPDGSSSKPAQCAILLRGRRRCRASEVGGKNWKSVDSVGCGGSHRTAAGEEVRSDEGGRGQSLEGKQNSLFGELSSG